MLYNDTLDADEQITAEEDIAARIFEASWHDPDECNARLTEETCAILGREILLEILRQFRPDLVED